MQAASQPSADWSSGRPANPPRWWAELRNTTRTPAYDRVCDNAHRCMAIAYRQGPLGVCYAVSAVNMIMSSQYFRRVLARMYDSTMESLLSPGPAPPPSLENYGKPYRWERRDHNYLMGSLEHIRVAPLGVDDDRIANDDAYNEWKRDRGLVAGGARPPKPGQVVHKACPEPLQFLLPIFGDAVARLPDTGVVLHPHYARRFADTVSVKNYGVDGGHAMVALERLLRALEPDHAIFDIGEDGGVDNAKRLSPDTPSWDPRVVVLLGVGGFFDTAVRGYQLKGELGLKGYTFDHVGFGLKGMWTGREGQHVRVSHAVGATNLCGRWLLVDSSGGARGRIWVAPLEAPPGGHPDVEDVRKACQERFSKNHAWFGLIDVSHAVLVRDDAMLPDEGPVPTDALPLPPEYHNADAAGDPEGDDDEAYGADIFDDEAAGEPQSDDDEAAGEPPQPRADEGAHHGEPPRGQAGEATDDERASSAQQQLGGGARGEPRRRGRPAAERVHGGGQGDPAGSPSAGGRAAYTLLCLAAIAVSALVRP